MDKYIEKNGNGYILTEFTEVGHIGNEYPCPQPHPFKDGEDVTSRYRLTMCDCGIGHDCKIGNSSKPCKIAIPKEQEQGDVALMEIFKKEPVNTLLSNALRHLDNEQMKVLTESLAERCGLKVKEQGDDYWKRRCLAAERCLNSPYDLQLSHDWQDIKSQEPKQ